MDFSLTEEGKIGIDKNRNSLCLIPGICGFEFIESEHISYIVVYRGGDIVRGAEFRGELCNSQANILHFD